MVTSRGVIALSRAPAIHTEIARISGATQPPPRYALSSAEVLSLVATEPRAIVIDAEHAEASDIVHRLATMPLSDRTRVVVVTRDLTKEVPRGAHVVVTD